MANTTFDVNKAKKEFQSYYQNTITALKEGHPQYNNVADTAIVRIQFDVLWAKIPKTERLFDFDKFTEYQKEVFYKALIQQIYYVLKEGDFTDMSGYGVSTNTFLSPENMEKIAVSKAARKTLLQGGLLYQGTNGSGVLNRFPGRVV